MGDSTRYLMRSMRSLIGIQIRSFWYGLGGRRGRRGVDASIIGVVAAVSVLCVMVVVYLFNLGCALAGAGMADAIPALTVMIGALASISLTFFKAPGTVFGCRDHDLIAALPIPTACVVAARMLPLYTMAVGLSLLAAAPLYAAYALAVSTTPATLLLAGLCAILAPLAPVALATLASLALTAVSVRFRHAGVVQIALSVALIIAIMVCWTAVGAVDETEFAHMVTSTSEAIALVFESAYPPAAWVAAAVTGREVAGIIPFALLSLGVPAAVTTLFAARYPSINALATAGHRVRRRTATSTAATSPLRALVVKELRAVISMPVYALNCCSGVILMVLAAGAIAFAGVDEVITAQIFDGITPSADELALIRTQVDAMLPWIFGFCGALTITAAPALSLEGGAAWIMLAVPVSAQTILASKLLANLVIGGAGIAVSAVLLLIGGVTPVVVAQCVIAACGLLTGIAALALSVDARRPNFAFLSPAEVIKRGLPSMVGGLAGVAVSCGGGMAAVALSMFVGSAAATAFSVVAPLVVAACGLMALRAVAAQGFPGKRWG